MRSSFGPAWPGFGQPRLAAAAGQPAAVACCWPLAGPALAAAALCAPRRPFLSLRCCSCLCLHAAPTAAALAGLWALPRMCALTAMAHGHVGRCCTSACIVPSPGRSSPNHSPLLASCRDEPPPPFLFLCRTRHHDAVANR